MRPRVGRSRSWRFRAAIALLLAAVYALAGCGGAAQQAGSGQASEGGSETGLGTLVVGSEVNYPPFESVDANGNMVGFDIELIEAVGKAAGYDRVEIRNIKWDSLIPALNARQVDAVISAMTITDERAQASRFSDPYFTAGQAIMVKKGSPIRTVADLSGKNVGVQGDTTGQFAVEKQNEAFSKMSEPLPPANIKPFQSTPDAINALVTGQVDAVVVDLPVLQEYLKDNPDAGVEITGPPFTVEYYGIAMRLDDTALADRINRALAQVKADGTYDRIYAKYFGSK